MVAITVAADPAAVDDVTWAQPSFAAHIALAGAFERHRGLLVCGTRYVANVSERHSSPDLLVGRPPAAMRRDRRGRRPRRALAAAVSLAVLHVSGGLLGCRAPEPPEAAPQPDTSPPLVDPLREDQRLARLDYCREAVALKIRESWRDASPNFRAGGQLRNNGRVFFYPVHRGISRACDQLLRDEHGDFERFSITYGRVERLVALANLYAEDTRALHSLAQARTISRASQREIESIFAHMRALYSEWERVERALQLKSYALQAKNNEALLSHLEGAGAHLQRRKVEFVIELRRLRRCYTDPQEELDCASVADAVTAAFRTWSTPTPGADALEFDRQRAQTFWLATFEEDATTLITLLQKRPPKLTDKAGPLGLVFDVRVDLAVGRLLRDASTLAFDFP